MQYGKSKENNSRVAIVNCNRVLLCSIQQDSCIAAGSLITLADGRRVTVESLTGKEELLVWNLYTGTYDIAPILFIDSDPQVLYEVIKLYLRFQRTVFKGCDRQGTYGYRQAFDSRAKIRGILLNKFTFYKAGLFTNGISPLFAAVFARGF